MAKFVSFPAVGQSHPVALYEAPVREEGDSDASFGARMKAYEPFAHVVVHVRLQKPETRRLWAQSFARALAAEEKRAKDAQDAGVEALALSEEGHAELVRLQREVVIDGVEKVEGLMIGGTDLATIQEGNALAAALHGAGLLGAAANAGRRGQTPTPQQLER